MQLRQLVEAELAQEATDARGDAGVVLAILNAGPSCTLAERSSSCCDVGADAHRAELEAGEDLRPPLPTRVLAEEDRAACS